MSASLISVCSNFRFLSPAAAAAFLIVFPVVAPATAQTPAAEKPMASAKADAESKPNTTQWQPTWADEFEGEKLDPKKWDFDLGNGFKIESTGAWIPGWGNDELQYYTDQPSNVFVKDGMLHIRVVKESAEGFDYTSARLKTRQADGEPLFNQKFGRFEFKAKLPTGQGIWPALWLLPQDETHGPWAASGEIDVLEARGQNPHEILGTLHYGSQWPANKHSGETFQLPDGGSIADFHVYAVEWEPGEIRWYFDGKQFASQSSWYSSKKTDAGGGVAPRDASEVEPWPAPFDHPFYIVMNVAVGGKFLGNPDATTQFPVEMVVDYVRVFEKAGGYGPAKERGGENYPFEE